MSVFAQIMLLTTDIA